MSRSDTARARLNWVLAAVLSFAASSCSASPPAERRHELDVQTGIAPLEAQARVMSMADAHIASLGEAVYLLTRNDELDPRGRWLAQSFLRNGVGATIDIGAGPNPPVNLLDLLVLASLQTWSFGAHWIPAGIEDAGASARERLERAEAELWASAGTMLSEDQLRTLRRLIDAWIAENPDQTVVSLVRFDEFADERKISSLSLRGQATGLLRAVSEASGSIDDVRLLGERLLWYAGRYPYLLGEQTELTAYRLIDQPEGAMLFEAVEAVRRLSGTFTERADTIRRDFADQQAAFFLQVSAERVDAIAQARDALETVVRQSLENATQRVNTERIAAIEHFFEGLTVERTLFLDDLESREDLRGLMTELHDTISASGGLAHELTGTVEAIDRLVSRFDVEDERLREPLRMTDVRDAAIETARAAEQMTRVLELSSELVESRSWDQRILSMTEPANAVVDRAFWRGAVLIGLLIGGLALLRLVTRSIGEKGKT